MPIKIKSCKLRIIKIPFVVVFKHFLKSRSEVESLIVEIELESGQIGYGESVPREYVTGESVESVKNNLLNIVFPVVRGLEFKDSKEAIAYLKDFDLHFSGKIGPRNQCVRAAFELAILDAIGKFENISTLEMLGGNKSEEIIYSGIISAEKPMVVKQLLKKFNKLGINQIKLKVGKDLDDDLKNVMATRKIIGDEACIRVDANEGFDLDHAKKIFPQYIEMGVVSVEQPLAASNREAFIELMKMVDGKMKICLDESLCSIEDAKWFIDNKAANLFNMRVSKNGGLLNSLEIYKLAQNAGIECQLGAQVGETSILSAAGRIFAALTGNLLFHEGSYGTQLLSYDLTKNPKMFGEHGIGSLEDFYKLPGLGVDVDVKLLEKMTIETF